MKVNYFNPQARKFRWTIAISDFVIKAGIVFLLISAVYKMILGILGA